MGTHERRRCAGSFQLASYYPIEPTTGRQAGFFADELLDGNGAADRAPTRARSPRVCAGGAWAWRRPGRTDPYAYHQHQVRKSMAWRVESAMRLLLLLLLLLPVNGRSDGVHRSRGGCIDRG
jgi:hypothetical protein